MSVSSPSRSDRTVRVLGWTIAIVILAILTGFLYVAVSGVFQPHSPRTAVENATQTLEQDLSVDSGDPKAWAEYIGVLTYAERYSEASRAIEDAYESVSASMTVPVQIAELELLYAKGAYDEVLGLSDGVFADIDAAVEYEKTILMAKDLDPGAIEGMSIGAEERVTVHVVLARVYREQGHWDLVLVETTAALAQNPVAADVLTLRGIAYAAVGDTDAARSDFERALEFDYEPAREELEKLER